MKVVSIERWPGGGGIAQVAGTSSYAKAAIKVLQEYGCTLSGWTVLGSRGDRVYTYRVENECWRNVSSRLRNLDNELQLSLI